ncbi:MAG: hypothetical protein H0Z38_06950 [Firmicutes bacterium]|nr:hypothetical protein [Bacillota bacterium]
MRKSVVFLICFGLLFALPLAVAAKGPKKAPPGQVKNQTEVEADIGLYLSNAGFDAKEQEALFFLLSMSGFQTEVDEVIAFWRSEPSGLEITFRLGFPPVLLDGELLVWQHPPVLHSPLPLVRERYRHRFEHSWGWEHIDRSPGKYEYTYENKLRGITERIEVKPQKYSYLYESRVIIEKLEIQFAAGRYEYTYRNRLTGEKIHRTGKAEWIGWRDIPQYLPKLDATVSSSEESSPVEVNFKLEFHFDF